MGGGWFSRFRSHQTTKEQLEQIEADIQSIEDYKWSKLRQQKNLMALVFYGSGLLYTVVAILFYFCFLPLSYNLYDKCIYSLPLIVLPAIAYLLQRSMQNYFRWVIENNEDRLSELRKQKRKILDKIMDTETYKVAKELLEKYDPSSLKPERTETSPQRTMTPGANQSLRYRSSLSQQNSPVARHFMNTSNPNLNTSVTSATPQVQARPLSMQQLPQQQQQQQQQQLAYAMNMQRGSLMLPPPPRLTRPVLPADRSLMEKMVDFVVGDGPNNRYALICCYCHSHNGMALKDEFEYLSFKCCYCSAYNPARKMRPFAPRISSTAQPVVEEPDSESEKTDKAQDEAVDSDTHSEKPDEIRRASDAAKGAEMTDDEDEENRGKCSTEDKKTADREEEL